MELQIIRAREFIRLGAKGHFDLKASKAVLGATGRGLLQTRINQALLDLRALHPGPKPVFSPNDLVTLVNTFHEVGFTHKQRLAVLYGSDPHHRARLFAFIAKLRGWKVQAFDNFEEAVTWLSAVGEPQVETEFRPGPKKVAVAPVQRGGGCRETRVAARDRFQICRAPPAACRCGEDQKKEIAGRLRALDCEKNSGVPGLPRGRRGEARQSIT